MSHQNGYTGRILKVDLSNGSIHHVPTEPYSDRFLGGRGIGAKIYWDEVSPEINAFDPENRLIFTTGPVTATTGFAGSRWQVFGKSPLREGFSYANLGGAWGASLKQAGYDALVVSGSADRPVYLWIGEDSVEIRSADHLKGKDPISRREMLKDELGKAVRVVTFGPAGENRIIFATLLADNDSSGSSGFGAVMGSKNLQAIVTKGKKKAGVADPEKVKAIKELIRPQHPTGMLEKIMGPPIGKKQICYDCHQGCSRRVYQGISGRKGKYFCEAAIFYGIEAMEYYQMNSYVEKNDDAFEATKLCDVYGLDTFVIDGIVLWLKACRNKGVLTESQTGLPLSKIGTAEFMEVLLKKINDREGIGDLLADGPLKAAKALGPEAEQMLANNVTLTGHRFYYFPRMFPHHAIFHAMEPRVPIQHLHETLMLYLMWCVRTFGISGEWGPSNEDMRTIAKRFWGGEVAGDFTTYEGKALSAAKIQDRQYAKESLILCDFRFPITYTGIPENPVGDPALFSRICAAVTGRDIDQQGLDLIAERVLNLQRAILIREGHKGREDDILPESEFTVPLEPEFYNFECFVPAKGDETVSKKGVVFDRNQFEKMKDEYYTIRGWDVSTGLQKKQRLEDIDLKNIAEEMDEKGLLG